MGPRIGRLVSVERLLSWAHSEVQCRKVRRAFLFNSRIRGSYFGHLLHQIGTLTKRTVDGAVDRVTRRIRYWQLIERLNLDLQRSDRQRSATAKRSCQVRPRDFLS